MPHAIAFATNARLPVQVGVKSGIGFVIVVDQLPRLVGAHLEKTGFLRDTFAILVHLLQTSHVTLAVSAAIVVLIFLVPRVPAPLVAVAAATRARGPCCSTDPHRQLGGGLVSIPQDYLDRPVAVIGAGTLGRRIALMFATRGGLVRINARHAENGAAAVDFVERQIGGLLGALPGWRARGRAEFVARVEDAVAGAWLVIESVPERLELKQEIFAQLESAAPRDAILSSNSSSYASRLIVAGLSTTDRMLNTHFYMPPTQIAVDVMSCGNTSQEVLDFVLKTFPDYGLRPFLVRRESTGFIFNRIWAAIKREALDVVAGGVSTPDDVDEMWKLVFGTEIGPFRAMDQVGLDVVYDIEAHYAAENPTLPAGPRNLLRRYLDAGKLGVKTGEGFYADYPKPKPQD